MQVNNKAKFNIRIFLATRQYLAGTLALAVVSIVLLIGLLIPKINTTIASREKLEADFKKRENDLIKDIIDISEKKYGKAEFRKIIGKDPKKLTYKEATDFNRREVNKGSVFGKIKNFIDDDEKYRKEKGIVDWLTKDVRKIGNFVKDKLKKK